MSRTPMSSLPCILASLALVACGGGSDPGNAGSIGGTVQGLSASGLRLQLAVGTAGSVYHLDVPAGASSFTFEPHLMEGTHYKVTIESQPAGQTCAVGSGEGDMGPSAVRTIAVFCGTTAYGVGGTVAGLAAGGEEELVLELNGVELRINANGTYAFADRIPSGAGYLVIVRSPPPGKQCTVAHASDTMPAADVTDVDVTCSLTIPAKPVLSAGAGVRQLRFSWGAIPGAASYRLYSYRNPDGSDLAQVGGDLTGTSYDLDVPVLRHDWVNTRYRVDACNVLGCTASDPIAPDDLLAIGYFTGSSTEKDDALGSAIALSDDGNTLAVGAPWDDGPGNALAASGAVYVFVRTGGAWTEQAYLRASNPDSQDQFGYALTLSGDGNTLAVGAFGESSASATAPGDNSVGAAGAVYVFTRSNATWSQPSYVKPTIVRQNADFGTSVALSGDGSTLAVGGSGDSGTGGAWIFARSGSSWSQQASLKGSNTEAGDAFGFVVALSTDGNTLGVGAVGEDSASTVQTDNSASSAGAAYVFTRSGTSWSQQAYIKAAIPGADDDFGYSIALSGDGGTLAVGAEREDSAATGINGAQGDDSARWAGAAYVFTRSGSSWSQQAYVKASNTGAGDWFGRFLALSRDGNTLAVVGPYEASSSLGVGGVQSDNSAPGSGAAYVFTRGGSSWAQQAYVKRSNLETGFGHSIALSADGSTLAVGGGSGAYLY